MINNVVTILNKFILIHIKFVTPMLCEDGAITISIYISQGWACIHTPCRHTLHIHIHIVSIWILQSVECPHTPCRLTVYIKYTAKP